MRAALVRQVLYPLHQRLKGMPTLPWLARLEESQWLEPARLEELQLGRLRGHLAEAYARVPYYRRVFDEHGIDPRQVGSLEDFRRVPFLTRDTLRGEFAALRARGRFRGVQRVATGGSTGSPVSMLVDAERMGINEAIRLRAHRWFGLEPGDREVVLWGSPIEVGRQDRIRELRDRLLNSRLISAFDLGEAALGRYAETIRRDRPRKMYGYASAFYLLARYHQARSLPAPSGLRAIFTTAEPLFDFQREAIAAAFGCRVATEYGCRDGGLAATECPAGSLHVPAEAMVVEVDAPAGEPGEIVLTNLYSAPMPVIRYRTGDIGCLEAGRCPCGRSLPRLARVDGRRTDFLVTPDGRILHALSVIYVLRETPGLRQFRVTQPRLDLVAVDVVPEDGVGRGELMAVRARLSRLLGEGVEVGVKAVPELSATASGKFRYVTSAVADRHVDELLGRAGPVQAPMGGRA